MNEDNYDRLPPQGKQTFLWKAKDKRKHNDYKWDAVYNTKGRLAWEQITPNRYGILYRSISDSRVPYTYYTLPYAGKPEEITDDSEYVTGTDNHTKYLAEGLEQHLNLQGRNISMDRYFTRMTISEYLPDKGMTVVGTMRSDRADIQKEMKETKSRKSPTTFYAYNTDIKSVLVSYVIKTKSGVKNVLVLSSMHRNALTTKYERKKPHVITFYDRRKGGADVMDMMAGIHTTRFKSRR